MQRLYHSSRLPSPPSPPKNHRSITATFLFYFNIREAECRGPNAFSHIDTYFKRAKDRGGGAQKREFTLPIAPISSGDMLCEGSEWVCAYLVRVPLFFVGGSSSFSSSSPPCLLACLTMSEQRSAVFRREEEDTGRFKSCFKYGTVFFKEKKRKEAAREIQLSVFGCALHPFPHIVCMYSTATACFKDP